MKIWHTSDIHLSFGDNDEIKKPMDQRSWSKGSPNYVGYLEKLSDFGLNQIDNGDLVLISGDLTHEMKQQYAARNLRWVRKNTRGHIVVCGGNHDQKIDFKLVRLENIGENIHLLSPGEMISIGEYTVGCFSDHKQQADIEDASGYLDMAAKIVTEASKRKTKPIMMSHYPLSLEVAQKIGELGVMVYVSGHVHCTSNKTADGNDWTWYDKQVKPTDDQVINGCYFSTGTTDILLNKINQIYRQITHGTSSNFVAGNSSNLREQAAKAFGCHIKFVDKFEKQDPFNLGNVVSGFMCHQKNVMNGSLFITHVNSVKVANQLIYGTPKLAYPYKQGTTEYIDFNKDARYFMIANKWNGMNVLFFKYSDNSNTFISAKSKGSAFLADGDFGNFLSLAREALGSSTIDSKNLPDLLSDFTISDIQSKSFELCGKKEPHLVAYDFDIALKPLFVTFDDGRIRPIQDSIEMDYGFGKRTLDFKVQYITDNVDLKDLCRSHQQNSFFINEMFRKKSGLPHKYEYEHFLTEGNVLYLLDASGYVIDRTLYKIKPKDIEEVHWQSFDKDIEGRVKIALRKIADQNVEPTEDLLKSELDMGPKEWSKFGNQVMKYIKLSPEGDKRKVLILAGFPGSGKSTFARQLASNKMWVRVNQDEMGSRNACKKVMEEALKSGLNVVIDRCNFDVNQRKSWLDLAQKYNIKQVDCLVFKTDIELCKQRIVTRTDHPTIKPEEGSKIIVDKFQSTWSDPDASEGFSNILVTVNNENLDEVLDVYSKT